MSIFGWRVFQWIYVVMIVEIPGIYAKCCDTGTIIHHSGNAEWVTDMTNTCECSSESILLGGVSLFTNKPHGYSAVSLAFKFSSRDQRVYKNLCHSNVKILPKSTFETHTTTLPILSNMVSTSRSSFSLSANVTDFQIETQTLRSMATRMTPVSGTSESSNLMEVLHYRNIKKSFLCITPSFRTFPYLGTTTSSLNDVDGMYTTSDEDLFSKSFFSFSKEQTTETFLEEATSKASKSALTPIRLSPIGSTNAAFTYSTLRDIFEISDTGKTSTAASALINYNSGSSQAPSSTANVVDVKTTDNSLSVTSKYTASNTMNTKNSHTAMTNNWYHLSTSSSSLTTFLDGFLESSTSRGKKGTNSVSQKMTTIRNQISTEQEETTVITSPFIPTTLAKSFLTTTMSAITTKNNLQKNSEED
ncbi:hypothetical protein HOLleu_05076 [Holothuria leucospilota]|uniref:Uncharacterized protein n=1 Tax=Holothuria leucospilota TaxID=206669 RepID=A0A9Q1CKK4_HOLLE|nr:hypothetical protein HOLleu_05076 [Holothuria leucospilota]